MVRVKMLQRNETAIIENGHVHLFGTDGRCYEDDAGNMNKYMTGACDLPIISLLTSNGQAELGVVWQGFTKISRYRLGVSAMQAASILQVSRGFVKMLRRSGKVADIAYNQLIFVYPDGYDILPILGKLIATEILE